MLNMCQKQSKLELVACFAAGAVVAMMGCAMMCGDKSMRSMRKKACRAAHRVSDFVVDNLHSLM